MYDHTCRRWDNPGFRTGWGSASGSSSSTYRVTEVLDLKVAGVLRSAESDDRTLGLLLRRAVWGKRPGHGMDDPGFLPPSRSMSMIGG